MLCALLLLGFAARLPSPQEQASTDAPAARTLELRNGRWFDGRGFEERTLYAVEGRFARERPAVVDRTLDLAGGYVVPPFAEAHNHNVHDGADSARRKYLEQGVFYVKNPNSLPRSTTSIRAQVNCSDGIDVVFAGGGLTSSGGHPVDIVRQNVGRGLWTEADGDGGFYFALDDAEDLAESWPAIRAQPRDFLKTYLLYSEEYAERSGDEATFGWRGLDPALLPEIVRRAHAEGWRVSTHVETAADFQHALAAGVDEINHMPGFRPLVGVVARAAGLQPPQAYELSAYAIRETDARRAGEQGTVVVTTLGELVRALEAVPFDDPARAEADQVMELVLANLELLRRHHVRIALGSDEYDIGEGTVVDEFLALQRLGVFEPAALLRAWCEDTALAIFPGREIGKLEPGHEASFLVLGADPLEDPNRVRDIRLRVKQGRVVDPGRWR
jgi:imidazolonepropionase-like amidohydrolase